MAKDSPRTTAGELLKIVESRGQKPDKKYIKQQLHQHMLFGRVSPRSSKNNLQHIELSDTTGTSNGTGFGFYAQMKLKNELFSIKHSRWV